MKTPKESPSLVADFAKVLKSVKAVKKHGKNGKLGYPYMRIVDLSTDLRGPLLAKGIVIFADDVEKEFTSWEQPDGKIMTEARVTTEFTVTNGKETLPTFSSCGSGRDYDGKALFIAQTGALKAWLKRLGLIFGEYDDPEWDYAAEPGRVFEPSIHDAYGEIIQDPKERAFKSLAEKCQLTPANAVKVINAELQENFTGWEQVCALPKKKFDQVLEILSASVDLLPKLEESVKLARAKKAQSQVQPINGEAGG